MKQFYIIFILSVLLAFTVQAVEVTLPDGIGRIDITNRVVTVLTQKSIPDSEYTVIVNGKKVVVVFSGGRGVLK